MIIASRRPQRRGRLHREARTHDPARRAARQARRPSVTAAVIDALGRQPRELVKTLIWDQGREIARWRDIEKALGVGVCICDPRSPWQRPTNEQTNGVRRRWLPKGTDLDVGDVRLAVIEDWLNTMPRKLLDWHSAHSVYTALCRTHR